MNNIVFKKMDIADLEVISTILTEQFDKVWNYNILKSELTNANSHYIAASFENNIIAFGGVWKSGFDAHITNIIVHKNFRRKNIGSLILKQLINYTIEQNIPELTLEVHEDNIPAQNLYKKFHFEVLGKRKNYYKQKDAIIMTKYILGGNHEK